MAHSLRTSMKKERSVPSPKGARGQKISAFPSWLFHCPYCMSSPVSERGERVRV